MLGGNLVTRSLVGNRVVGGTWSLGSGFTWTLPAFTAGGDITTDRWLSQDSNTFFGVDVAGAGNLTHSAGNEGHYNTGIGTEVLEAITSGCFNTGIGWNAQMANTSGHQNVAVGAQTLSDNSTGSYNTGLGQQALYHSTVGHGNIGIGYDAGANITTGNYNIVIGYNLDTATATGRYQVNIGKLIQGALPYIDGSYATVMARDIGVGEVEVARAASAADPWFGIGNNANVLKGTYAGLCGFFGATPVAQQTKATHNNWAAFGDVVNALVSLGLLDAA